MRLLIFEAEVKGIQGTCELLLNIPGHVWSLAHRNCQVGT